MQYLDCFERLQDCMLVFACSLLYSENECGTLVELVLNVTTEYIYVYMTEYSQVFVKIRLGQPIFLVHACTCV